MTDFQKKVSFTWKDAVKYFVKFLLSFGILGLCFHLIDLEGFKKAIISVDLLYYSAAICITTIASIVMPALVTWTAQRTGRLSFSLMDLIIINFSVRLYTILLPRAIATGMRFLKYRKNNAGKDALVIIVFEKIAQMTIMMTFASVFLFLELEKKNLGQDARLIYILTLMFTGICFLAFFVFFSEWLASVLQKVTLKMDFITPSFIKQRMDSIWEAVSAFQNLSYNDIIACLAYSGISYVLYIVAPYIIAQSMNIEISIYALAWMRAIIMLLTAIPITVAGLGVREVGFIAFLELYGVTSSTALAFSLLLFFQHIFIASIGLINEIWIHLVKPFLVSSEKLVSTDTDQDH